MHLILYGCAIDRAGFIMESMNSSRKDNRKRTRDEKTQRLVFLALCTAFGLICSYVELLIPLELGVPGAKPGLPNIVTVTLLYSVGTKAAFFVTVARIFLGGFMFGNLFSIVYSLSGFLLSFLTMLLLKKTDRFGMTGVSIAGGVMHNIGQLIAAALLTDGYVFAWMPPLIAAGTAAGALIGILSAMIARRMSELFKKM